MIYKSYSHGDTEKIAGELAKRLKAGDVICLDGELGAGKTAFTKGLCKAIGVTDMVTSPTYTIINRYNAEIPVFHIDAYRIDDADEMYEIGFEDCLQDGICIIEWSVTIKDILPESRIEIIISRNIDIGDNYREISVNRRGQ